MSVPPQSSRSRQPHAFDPASFARSVIALPLFEEIEQELATTEAVAAAHPDLRATHNAAIFLNPGFQGGLAGALEEVRELLAEAEKNVGAETRQSIDDPDPAIASSVALAWLEGPVIRQLLGKDAGRNRPAAIERIWPTRFEVIIDVNLGFKPIEIAARASGMDRSSYQAPDARRAAKLAIRGYIEKAKQMVEVRDPDQGVDDVKTELSNQYVFARLEGKVIKKLVELDSVEAEKMAKQAAQATPAIVEQNVGRKGGKTEQAIDAALPKITSSRFRTIHHIWPDFEVRSCIVESIRTVKVDAARNSFTASGKGVTWAVMDTGIDALHPHFALHQNIDAASPYHADFTGAPGAPQPLKDVFGHGTHVAGIIAGEQRKGGDPAKMRAVWQELGGGSDSGGKRTKVARKEALESVSGMAPECKLVSLKVLDEFGIGKASNVIAAIAHVQMINGHGRDLKIHGVNLSLGHSFDPKWFGCGHSPLCVEVNRLVKSGVVVVVAAGNTGYGRLQTMEGESDASLDLTINDPGNAEYAITVGSTHRDKPHLYGVSYFSSKGPTGDGRFKPDLLAPGEKIISCAAANSELLRREGGDEGCFYFENSGTSMAAPHVSGAIAAFLSIRGEFIGEAEKIKQIFTSTATDLGRDRYFQGAGLVDLMRAIQSV